MSDSDQAPKPETKTIEYKIKTRCARCNYPDSVYNKHEYTVGEPQDRTIMWQCLKCDKRNMFKYTVGEKREDHTPLPAP